MSVGTAHESGLERRPVGGIRGILALSHHETDVLDAFDALAGAEFFHAHKICSRFALSPTSNAD